MKDKEKLVNIIDQAKQGNQEAFKQLYDEYVDNVYFTAWNYLHNENSARDVVQDVFIRVHKNLQKLENPAAFYTWIKRITLNVCYDYDQKREPYVDLGDEMTVEDFEDISQKDAKEIIENKELQKTIYDSIQSLKPALRTVGVLRYYDQLSVSEISEILSIPEGTVHSRLYHMKNKLKTILENQGISAKTIPGFVLTPSLFNIVYETMAASVQTPVVQNASIGVGSAVVAAKGASMAFSTKAAIAAVVGVAGIAGVVYLNQQEPTPVKLEQKAPATAIEQAKIESIEYPKDWTKNAFELHVKTTNDAYDEILVDGSPSLMVHENGEYAVTLMLDGKQIDERIVSIDSFDFESPDVENYSIANTTYTIQLKDNASKVNYGSLRYYENDELVQKDMQIDYETNTITVNCDFEVVGKLYIQDYAGNELELILQDKVSE